MATHKVPQDVEAEDKLLGPLSLKQFIFTILGLGFGYLTFFFATKIHFIVALIWIPPTLVCFVLGLYQRKDQPVEVYLASALKFYLKPHRRKWSQDGYEERVIVTAPPKIEHNYTKNFSSEEAVSRLTSLSRMMDSRGWASKLSSDWQNPQLATAAASDRLVHPSDIQQSTGIDPQTYMQPVDVMDEGSSLVAQDFQAKITQTDTSAKQHALQVLQQARQDDSTVDSSDSVPVETVPEFKKYPQMHQKVVQPAEPEEAAPPAPSDAIESPARTEPVAAAPTPAPEPQPISEPPLPISTDPQVDNDGSVEIRLH